MKKIFLLLVCILGAVVYAQSPQLTVNGADSLKVRMSQMIVKVKIVGNVAYTTSEMHFTNKSTRQMEAELLFPLPEGVSVSHYAIDINGHMREAVPVDKNKGKQVFEAIEHRRVDPGLLEKVEGNNFKTRIYPILPNGERTILIGYEQELSGADANNLAYQMVSKYHATLDKFEVTINVLGGALQPTIIENGKERPVTELQQPNEWTHSYQTRICKTNYRPENLLTVKIPVGQEAQSVLTQSVNGQHYFYANLFVPAQKSQRQKPASIGLVWDVSLSCRKRDFVKESQLLDAYFKAIQNTSVTLYTMGYVFEKKQVYTIFNGDWSGLKAALEATPYDGGTRFSKIKWDAHETYIVSTDGLSSLSENALPKTNKPVYIINSLVSSDFSFLNAAASQTGGELLNLNAIDTAQALDRMLHTGLRFLGIKDNYAVAEIFPAIGTTASGSFSISGISLKEKNELVLLFGSNGQATLEKKITIDVPLQNTNEINIEKLWAQKKIASLELQYTKNEQEIEQMGKKYGIITRNTSLIVLENVADYIAYDIVPPAELRDEFDRLSKQQRESRLAEQRSNWDNVADYHRALEDWWKKDLKYTAPKPEPKPNPAPQPRPEPVRPAVRTTSNHARLGTGQEMRISGTVSDQTGPLPGASVVIQGTGLGSQTDVDGRYSLRAKRGDVLVYSFIGLNDQSVRVRNGNHYNVVLSGSSTELGEVVVTAMGVRREKKALGYAVTTVSDKLVSETLSGKTAGVAISGANRNRIGNEQEKSEDADYGFDEIRRDIKTETWNPDRIYLKVLEAAPEAKKYEAYLELRIQQEQNPSFYFDVANFFYNKGDRAKALLVLSNIADLGLENHQLYKSLTYVLRQWEAYDDALFTANRVAQWRKHEPQSHRDLALALEDNKQYQAAFDALIAALEVNYYGEMDGQYEGVEDIILMDINRLTADHSNLNTAKLDPKYLAKMPVAIRIVLNWNQMDTDIDLHVIEPTGEECYFAHRDTAAGARFSKDFTEGYGPEQYLLRHAMPGKYQIRTNYYGERALTENGPATVMVEIYTTKNGKTTRKLQTIQLGAIKENQNLAMLTID
jgi:Vault protein inter-alpha-trypsin domain/CarboxypepD_reg-like domain/Uncharacterized protein conserved in bacteria (DUF2135)